MKIYLKKSHHKRGVKLWELPDSSSWEDILKEIPCIKDMIRTPYIRTWKNNNGEYIDFGSHNELIIVRKEFEDEQAENSV